MDSSGDEVTFVFTEHPPPDPPGWVDGLPNGIGQSCAFCGCRDSHQVSALFNEG